MDSIKKQILRWLGIVLGTTLAISLIILIIGIKLQWERPGQFANVFFFAGAIVLTIGLTGYGIVRGQIRQHTEKNSFLGRTTTNTPVHELIQHELDERKERDKPILLINAVGTLLIVISFLIYKFS